MYSFEVGAGIGPAIGGATSPLSPLNWSSNGPPPEKVSRKEIASTAPEVVRSRERSMEARMWRSGNAAPWPAESLVGG